MKKILRLLFLSGCLAAVVFLLPGCLKDSVQETLQVYYPVYQSLSQVRAGMKSGAAQPLRNTGKLNVFGQYIFLNEVNKGIHVIDNSNPAAPVNRAFIPVPNNRDIAVRGHYLYADSYSDVVVFDISNPADIRPAAFLDNVIRDKNRYWYSNQTNPDSIRVVVGYTVRDTTVAYSQYRRWSNCANCVYASADLAQVFYTAAPQVGVSGSMSRFCIVNNYLYAVSGSDLYTVSLADPALPVKTSTKSLGWNIETMYPFQNKLFIGSQTGMFIYDLANPAAPAAVSRFTHATSCDPVISDGNYAYVTLRSGTTCNGTANLLDVIDVSNLAAPVLQKTVALNNPHGLAKDGRLLFICDGADGLKLFDAAVPVNPQLKNHIKGLEAFDVIALNGRAIVVATDGLYQFAYDADFNLTLLSKIVVEKQKNE